MSCSKYQGNDPAMGDRVHPAGVMKEDFLEEAEGVACRKVFGDNG